MRISIDLTKSLQQNLAALHERIKDVRKKIAGLEKAIAETEGEIEKAKGEDERKKRETRVVKERKWFEKFHWFCTSSGKLAVGGKDAKQNDVVFAKHMDDGDLFFHADIQGGSAVILKCGRGRGAGGNGTGRNTGVRGTEDVGGGGSGGRDAEASDDDKKEVAQFAASFSNAWKNGNASVDVYCVGKGQLSKHASGGFIPVGGFAITGEREWFRDTKLGLRAGINDKNQMEIIPECSKRKLTNELLLFPGAAGREKGQVAKSLAKRFGVHPDELLALLPAGRIKMKA